MGFYGNLYTNLTTFFHNVWFKGTAKNDESFLNNTDILTNTVTAQPVIAYDGLNINSGNRWIQFKSELDTIQNGAGGTNSAGITIYHAPPVGVNPEDVANKTSELIRTPLTPEPEDDKFTNITENHVNSMEKGGYLTTQTANYDKAGHLVSLTEKIFAFPDVKTVRETANDAQSRVSTLEGQYATLESRVGTAENTLKGLTETTIPGLNSEIERIEGVANNAKTTADGFAERLGKAESNASQAKTDASNALTKANSLETQANKVSTNSAAIAGHGTYFQIIKDILIDMCDSGTWPKGKAQTWKTSLEEVLKEESTS